MKTKALKQIPGVTIFEQAPLTWTFFLISALVFFIARISDPKNVRFLALHFDQVRQSWYTLISYGFVHIEWYHILINMGILLYIGFWVERMLGQKRYFMLVMLGILAGGLSLIVRETGGIGFSAAGATILFYYYLAFPWKRELPFNLPNIILPVTLFGFSILALIFGWGPSVGHIPHLAGMFTGALLLLVFHKNHKEI